MKKILIQNAQIINEGESFIGSVLVEGDRIVEIIRGEEKVQELSDASNGSDDLKIINATGKILIPGVIDDQVHFRDPGLTHKGDIYSESRAAAAGGITSFMEMPNTSPQTITRLALKEKQAVAAKNSICNYSFYFGATNENLEEIKAVDPETVCGLKVFMGASTGNMLVDKEESLRAIFKHSPILVACHCEDEPTIRANHLAYFEEYGDDIPITSHPLIRSREACYLSSSFAIKLAKEYNTRLHILHLSTEEEMELFESDKELKDKKITAEVCVHHLWFDDRAYLDKGAKIKWNPAIKKASDRKALLKAVINNKIDIIATDHAPHTAEEKDNVYTKAPSGGPLVQHSLPAMMELWRDKKIDLETIVTKMCHNPAILFNIEKRGYIREGYKADLCIINPDSPWLVTKENTLYKCGWSPFEGTIFHSKVLYTIINGNIVYNNGLLDNKHSGKLLKFKR